MAQNEPIRVQIEGLDDLREMARDMRIAAREMREAAGMSARIGREVNMAARKAGK